MAITRKTTAPPVAPAPVMAPPPPPQLSGAALGHYAPAPAAAAAYNAAADSGPNFMDPGFYSGGFLVPQGRYVITDITIAMFKGDKQQESERKLGALVTFVPLNDPREEMKKVQFYSFGSEAHKSYMPNPATGKSIVPIPGAPSTGFNNQTNWFLFLNSLYDCGLPKGIATNSVAPLEGTWVYILHIDEPAERSTFASNTAEVQGTARAPKKIAVVAEILDGGKPWENNGGGWPAAPVVFADAAPPARPVNGAPAPAVAPPPAAVRPAPVVAPPTPAPVAAGPDAADIRAHATGAIADLLEAAAKAGQNTIDRLALRNGVFTRLQASAGEATAGAVLAHVFDVPGQLESVVGDLGYKVVGRAVVPA